MGSKATEKALGSGNYSRRTYEKANKSGAAILTSRGTTAVPRKMHRDNLYDWVESDKDVDKEKRVVTDPRKLVPFRGDNFAAIVESFMTFLPSKKTQGLKGAFTKDFANIREWNGVVSTSWIFPERQFAVACKRDPELRGRLLKRQDNRKGVKNRTLKPLEKFINNIKTLQGTGGVRPYAMPLMQCQYAIDHRWTMVKGKEVIQFRFVIGRSKPQNIGVRELRKSLVKSEAA